MLLKAQLWPDLLGQVLPDRHRLDHDGQLVEIATLLSDPAPVAAGLFAGDAALFQKDNLLPCPVEVPCRNGAHDTATDHDDIGRVRQIVRMFRGVRKGGVKGAHLASISTRRAMKRSPARNCSISMNSSA